MEAGNLAAKIIETVEKRGSLEAKELLELLRLSEKVVAKEPCLHRLSAPRVVVCGDTHGDLETVITLLRRYPPGRNLVVMLGDYVDRGQESLESASYLLATKLLHPRNLILLRGNHESPLINQAYGFYGELTRKARGRAFELFIRFNEVLATLPYAALLLPYRLFLVHGGIPTTMPGLKEIEGLPRKDLVPVDETAFQLLWNDPRENVEDFAPSDRGEGAYFYGGKAVERFLRQNKLSGIIRSHEAVENGYRYSFQRVKAGLLAPKPHAGFEGLVLTVFSSRAYGLPPKIAVIERGSIRVESL